MGTLDFHCTCSFSSSFKIHVAAKKMATFWRHFAITRASNSSDSTKSESSLTPHPTQYRSFGDFFRQKTSKSDFTAALLWLPKTVRTVEMKPKQNSLKAV